MAGHEVPGARCTDAGAMRWGHPWKPCPHVNKKKRDGRVKSNHCNPVVRKVDGNVPLYRFMTMFKLEKNPNALSLDPSNSSGMMPFHKG